jgi:hypothetical protein
MTAVFPRHNRGHDLLARLRKFDPRAKPGFCSGGRDHSNPAGQDDGSASICLQSRDDVKHMSTRSRGRFSAVLWYRDILNKMRYLGTGSNHFPPAVYQKQLSIVFSLFHRTKQDGTACVMVILCRCLSSVFPGDTMYLRAKRHEDDA